MPNKEKVMRILNQHADKSFVKRILEYKEGESPVLNNADGSFSTHSMSANHSIDGKHIYVYPTVVKGKNGKLKRLDDENYGDDGRPAMNNALKTGNYIEFNSLQDAIWFSKHYKEGTGAMLK